MIKAVFFDMDGTIADSEKIVWKVTKEYFAKKNIFLTQEEEKALYGLIWKESIRKILESRGLQYSQKIKDAVKEKYVRHLKKEVAPVNGVYNILEDVKKHFKIALATNSRIREVEIIFNKLNFHKYFDLKLARNHIKNVKPHPEIYLKGAQILGVKPNECVIFEDSIVAITAAKNSGAYCIAIQISYQQEELKTACPDLIIKSYDQITSNKIRELFG